MDKPERHHAKSKEPDMKDLLLFYSYEIFRKGNSMETENRLMVTEVGEWAVGEGVKRYKFPVI